MKIELREGHKYYVDGVLFPSVTEILAGTGHVDKAGYQKYGGEYYQLRGRYVHQASELEDDGNLDWSALDESYAGYVKGYRNARRADPIFAGIANHRTDPAPGYLIEQALAHPELQYCGTLDRLIWSRVTLGPRMGKIIDLKTSKQRAAWWGIQLAAYAVLVWRSYGFWPERFILQLNNEGDYRVIPYEDHLGDITIFLYALLDFYADTHDGLGDVIEHTLTAAKEGYGRDTESEACIVLEPGKSGTGVRRSSGRGAANRGAAKSGGRSGYYKWVRAADSGQSESKERNQPEPYTLPGGASASHGSSEAFDRR